MLESSGTWLESTRWVHPLEESPSRAGKTSGNTRHCAGSTKSSRTRAGSSRASPGATPAATYARSRTGKRASHHFCGVSRSGWASSGACQGKAVRRCRRRSSLLTSSPGAACFRQWSMEPLHRPRRWWASVPAKSQIRHFTMPPSQGVEVREQDLLQMHGSGRAARRVPPELHGLEPLGVVEREEPELRQDVCGAEQPRVAYRRQLTLLPGDLHVVGGERLAAVLEGEAARLQPHCGLATGQRLLAVEPPVEEPDVPQRVEDPGRARGEEGAPEVLLTVAQQRGVEAQDVLRAAATVLPAHVGPVPLGVVVLPPRVVRFRKFGEGFGLFEVPVGHPLLDAEGRFYVGLVRLAPLYLLLPYPEGPVDGPGLLGLEDPAPVGDEPLRWAVALDRRVEDAQEGGGVLGQGNGAGEDHPAVVLQHRDDVGVADAGYGMRHVAHVGRPDLAPFLRPKGHLGLLFGAPLGLGKPVELAVDGHHAADRAHADLRVPLLLEGGVDAERSQLRVLLRAADEVHRGEVHLAHAPGPSGLLVREARLALLDPAADHPVDGGPADPHVGCYGLHAPTVQVQRHHRLPRLPDVPCLVVGLEEAGELQGDDLLREDPPRRVLAEPPARADVDDVGDLVVVEPGVLGLELHDHAPNERLQAPAPGPPNLALLIERGQQAAPYALPGAVLL